MRILSVRRVVTHTFALAVGVFLAWLAFDITQSPTTMSNVPGGSSVPKGLSYSSQPAPPSSPMLTWQDYGRIASLIEDLPPWTDNGPHTATEWNDVTCLAIAMQTLDPADIERALLVYMSSLDLENVTILPDPDPRTKPLLLLRVMFDLPEREPFDQGAALAWHVQLAGGYAYRTIDTQISKSYAFPVSWTSTGPSLVAFRMNLAGYSGPGVLYQPHNEFRFFRTNFRYRQGLAKFCNIQINSWRDLWYLKHAKLGD